MIVLLFISISSLILLIYISFFLQIRSNELSILLISYYSFSWSHCRYWNSHLIFFLIVVKSFLSIIHSCINYLHCFIVTSNVIIFAKFESLIQSSMILNDDNSSWSHDSRFRWFNFLVPTMTSQLMRVMRRILMIYTSIRYFQNMFLWDIRRNISIERKYLLYFMHFYYDMTCDMMGKFIWHLIISWLSIQSINALSRVL